MKKLFPVLAFLVALTSCTNTASMLFKNELDTRRTDEVVIITRAEVEAKAEIQDGKLPVFEFEGKAIPSQVDDLDGDGKWDEVVLVFDFNANELVEANISWATPETYPQVKQRTNLRLGIKQNDGSYKEVDSYKAIPYNQPFKVIAQGEGVTWENDKMGFRVYFDCRNVKDLFGKRQPKMIADKVHTPGFGSYHDLHAWGMDVLHCGSSLGAGGIALWRNDSLYRVGSTDDFEYRKIVEGPLRSIFELQYSGWNVEGKNLKAVERISIFPGKYWFKSEVTFSGCEANDKVATGIVTSHLKNAPFTFDTHGFKCIGTHDVQSLNKDELGMAVMVPGSKECTTGRTSNTNHFKLGHKTVEAKGFSNIISETAYIAQPCENEKPATHYFFSVWGLENDQWKNTNNFQEYMKEEAEKFETPISKI